MDRDQMKKLVIALALVACAVGVYLLVPDVKAWVDAGVSATLDNPTAFAAYLRGFGALGPIVSFALMMIQCVAAPLPGFIITFANGMIWGFIPGALLSWTSAMAGASLCFFLARAFGRPLVEKLVGGSSALEVSDAFFEKFGTKTVLIARLLPFVSFDVISYGAGLTTMSFKEFFWATAVGQIPATFLYSYLASIGGAATSIKVLLYVFSAVAALLILFSAIRPWFMRVVFGKER